MPDTGSPWNIPYVENADLVSDWPADSLLVANAVAAGLSAAGNAGIGSNVVHTQTTTTMTTTSSALTNFTDVDVTITPSSNTAKILVIYNCGKMSGTTDNFTTQHVIARDTTTISPIFEQKSNPAGSFLRFGASIMTLDDPTTASPVTYRARININTGTLTVGNASIIAIEVAA